MSLFGDLPPENASDASGVFPLGKRRSSRDEGAPAPKHCKIWGRLSNTLLIKGPPPLLLITEGYRLKGYIGERKGEREDMQDAHTIIDDFSYQCPSLPNNM